MKKLFPAQQKALDKLYRHISRRTNTLDASDTGTGKTVVAAHIATKWCSKGRSVAVLCPKSVIPSWERELKECGVNPLFVMNYEKIRGGKTPFLSKRGKTIMKWQIPQDTLVFLDEVHKCKGPYTQNAQLYVSLTQQGYTTHAMSATAASDPTDMRALGFALGLHSLHKTENGKMSFNGWLRENGCYLNNWGKWELTPYRTRPNPALGKIHDQIFGRNGYRLRVSDFPDSFRKNMVYYEPVKFSKEAQIKKAFSDLELTPEILEDYIENGTVESSDNIVLVNILRARQLAESLKTPDIADMTEDLILEGKSVVVFVNFSDTVDSLVSRLQCRKIDGRQSPQERQEAIDRFQNDDDPVIVVNIAAGGTGVSLHDIRGERQRISLISPTYSPKDHLQCLGRVYRNGSKSDCIQKILYAADSVEEAVIKSLKNKVNNIQTINDGEHS